MRHTLIFLVLLALGWGRLFAQDTIKFCQANARMFSNCYTFIRTSASDKTGIFTHRIGTDDGQIWFGKGIFEEKASKDIALKFQPFSEASHIVRYPGASTDSTTICLVDATGPQAFFKLRFADTAKNHPVFRSNWESKSAKIANKDLRADSLTLFMFGRGPLITFKPLAGDSVIVFATDTNRIHLMQAHDEIFKRCKEGFWGKAMWTGEKTTLFTRREF